MASTEEPPVAESTPVNAPPSTEDGRASVEKSALSAMLTAVKTKRILSPSKNLREQMGGSSGSRSGLSGRFLPPSPPKGTTMSGTGGALSFPKRDNLAERCRLLSPPPKRKLGQLPEPAVSLDPSGRIITDTVLTAETTTTAQEAQAGTISAAYDDAARASSRTLFQDEVIRESEITSKKGIPQSPSKLTYTDLRDRLQGGDKLGVTAVADRHRNAVKLLEDLRQDVSSLESMVAEVSNFKTDHIEQRVAQLRRKQATLRGWRESFKDFFDERKVVLVKQAKEIEEKQQAEVLTSREELIAARDEIEKLESKLAATKQNWQVAREKNFAESTRLREREQRLRRQIDALASSGKTGRENHEAAVARFETVIAELEERRDLMAKEKGDQTNLFETREKQLQERIAMLEADPSFSGRGLAAERESLETTVEKLRQCLQRITQEWQASGGFSDHMAKGREESSKAKAKGWSEVERLEKEIALLGATKPTSSEEEQVLQLLQEAGTLASGRTRVLLGEVSSFFSQIWLLDRRNRDFVHALMGLSFKYPFHCPGGEIYVAGAPAADALVDGNQSSILARSPGDNTPLAFLKNSMQERLDTSAGDIGPLLDPIDLASPTGKVAPREWTTFAV
ncbi:unnamed protein product [Amoebophrya sp. A25]|nr:unnamed protein product [Amoebophrya sp. A25]|eukprot:GSA25T00012728001.1